MLKSAHDQFVESLWKEESDDSSDKKLSFYVDNFMMSGEDESVSSTIPNNQLKIPANLVTSYQWVEQLVLGIPS